MSFGAVRTGRMMVTTGPSDTFREPVAPTLMLFGS
jgi:hypothetical protein